MATLVITVGGKIKYLDGDLIVKCMPPKPTSIEQA